MTGSGLPALSVRPPGSWLIHRPADSNPARRLFCFPYAGAGAGSYFEWRSLLPRDVDLVVIQLPGRENRLREPLATDMGCVISAVVNEMAPLLDRPFTFFGHSFGALLAYECCVALQRSGHSQPHRLVASAANPPGWVQHLPRQLVHDVALTRLRERLGWRNIDDMDPDITAFALEVLDADLAMVRNHRFTPTVLPLHLTVVGAVDDPIVNSQAWPQWACFASSHEFVTTRGGHFFVDTQAEWVVRLLVDDMLAE